ENQDSAYAGPHLVAVADGMGGHAHGEVASAVAIATLATLDEELPGSDLADTLRHSFSAANDSIRSMVDADSSLEGMGTTLTALLYEEGRLCLAHIGDSRAYLLRDGALAQVTKDHTLVQSLVDEGRLSEEQAAVHPQRSLLLQALGTAAAIDPDINVYEVRAGDRWLLCSDGLSSYVSDDTIGDELSGSEPIETVTGRLVNLANRAGGADNITCVIADVVDVDTSDHPVVVGAATETQQPRSLAGDSAASRAAALASARGPEIVGEPDDEEPGARPRRRWWRFVWPIGLLVIIVLAGVGAWQWTLSQFYIAPSQGKVTIYRGLSQPVGPAHLNKVEQRTDIELSNLPAYERQRVRNGIEVASRDDAFEAVSRLGQEADKCVARQHQSPTPSPSGDTSGGCSP
ncbi:MAG: PP2C family protein-serine/threonine phosphatase, partial [Streptosporangiales bacterium]